MANAAASPRDDTLVPSPNVKFIPSKSGRHALIYGELVSLAHIINTDTVGAHHGIVLEGERVIRVDQDVYDALVAHLMNFVD